MVYCKAVDEQVNYGRSRDSFRRLNFRCTVGIVALGNQNVTHHRATLVVTIKIRMFCRLYSKFE